MPNFIPPAGRLPAYNIAMDTYQNELLEWRQSLDVNLRKKNSWLALAGLFWLQQGSNTFGSDPGNQIVFPPDSGPDRIGTFQVDGEQVILQAAEGVALKVNGKPAVKAVLAPDTSGSASEVTLDNLTLILIQREDALGIRLWDNSRKQRKRFQGRQWYPIQEDYRVGGEYQEYDQARPLVLQRKNAADYETPSAGIVNFMIGGKDCSLVVFEEAEGELFTLFNDLTNGQETYASGRYLVIEPPREGRVILDFNRAYNPPCAFTPYATCPLPPVQNRLDVQISAGEMSVPETP